MTRRQITTTAVTCRAGDTPNAAPHGRERDIQFPTRSRPHIPTPHRIQFASDNNAGICPEAWEALSRANLEGHVPAYGDDRWTAAAADRLRDLFETDCDVYFVFSGTAANSLALAALCRSYHAIACTPVSHIATDECGAPQFFSGGASLVLCSGDGASGRLGKLTASDLRAIATRRTDVHGPKVAAVSITQATELGTVYTPDDIAAIAAVAQSHHLHVHMDGARFANAVASLGVTPADVTWRAGVDVLCVGGTKNGLPLGEAVIFFNRALGRDFDFRAKQAGQLASKMRSITAPWAGVLADQAWLRHAAHANAMATRLRDALASVEGIDLLLPVQANAVFVRLPASAIEALHGQGWRFYEFLPAGGCRLMCAWDTTPDAVDEFAAAIAATVRGTG